MLGHLSVVGLNVLLKIERRLLSVDRPRFVPHEISPEICCIFRMPQKYHCVFVYLLIGNIFGSLSTLICEFDFVH